MQKEKPQHDLRVEAFNGAGGRTRTGTVSLPVDFESTTSANSITPAQRCYYTRLLKELQDFFQIFL